MSQRLIQCLLAGALIGGVVGTTVAPAAAQTTGPSGSASASDNGAVSGAPANANAPAAANSGAGGSQSTSTVSQTTGAPTGTAVSQTGTALPPGGGESTAAQTTATPTGAVVSQTGTALPPGGGESTVAPPGTVAQAAGSQVVPAAYLRGDDRLPPEEIETFLTQPRTYIDEQPLVAERVSARTERLVGSDQRTVPPIIAAAVEPQTTADQRAMIAVGLARATRAAEPIAPEYAAYLQESVAQSGNEGFIAAYNVAFQTTEIQTASIGAGAGAGGASASGGTLSGGGESGISGAIGGDDVVPQLGPTSGFGSSRSVVLTLGNTGGGTTTTASSSCTDASPTTPGCAVQ